MKWLMTLLDIFRSASRKIMTEQSEQIYFDDLASWLDLRSSELMEKENLHSYLTAYVNLLKDKRWLLRQQMEDGHIPDDLQSKCKGFSHLFNFTDNPDIKETLLLNSELEEKLEKILPNPEIEIVNPLLKIFWDIDNARKKFTDKVNQSGYPRIANLHKKLSSLQIYKSKVDKFEEDLRNKKRRLYLTEDKKKEKEKQLNALQEDPNYLLLLETRKKRESMIKETEEIETSVLRFFSEIKPLLQKYNHLVNANGLLNSYIEDSLNAFLNDEGLSIKHSFQHLRAVLNSGKFSWSVEENVSSLEKLDLIDESELERMQVNYLTLRHKLDHLEEPSIDEDKMVEIDDAEYRLQHFIKQIKKLEDEIIPLEDTIYDLKEKMSKEIELFQNLLSLGFGKELSIKI